MLSYYWFGKGDKSAVYLLVLFAATLLFELLMKWINKVSGFKFLYDIFSATEYTLFCMYYWSAKGVNKIRHWVKLSVILFVIVSLGCAWLVFHNEIQNRPFITRNIEIESTLLIIVYAHLLFIIDDDIPLPIYQHPDFWVGVGVLIFNSGVFVILVFYPMILTISKTQATQSYAYFLGPLNLIQYVCINIRFICLHHNKRLLIQ
ncbi:hypothetical protein ACFFGT_13005 [Mucilaginibacter angelicae]|uniref:Uncharacterized protein n=1 Tax=Mucilaginibacter angelicae TaxID=869718 RepID=A0ABV6L6N3_9SPHI